MQRPAAVDPKAARTETPRRAERLGARKIMAVDIAKGPIGHWDQTNAVFAFWQEIVDLAPAYAKEEAPQRFLDAIKSRNRPAFNRISGSGRCEGSCGR